MNKPAIISEEAVIDWCEKHGGQIKMTKLEEFIAANVASMDCVASCPDEVAIAIKEGKGNIRTDDYCNKCFARQILSLLTEEIKKSLLTEEEIRRACRITHASIGTPHNYHVAAQAQLDNTLKIVEGK